MGWRWYKNKWMDDNEYNEVYDRECYEGGQTIKHLPLIAASIFIGYMLGGMIDYTLHFGGLKKIAIYLVSIFVVFKVVFSEKIFRYTTEINQLLWILILGYGAYKFFIK